MRRLRHRLRVTGVDAAGHPERPDQLTGEIGQRVAEEVLGDHHVELLGVAHQPRGHRVEQHGLVPHPRVLLRRRLALLQVQAVLRRCRVDVEPPPGRSPNGPLPP